MEQNMMDNGVMVKLQDMVRIFGLMVKNIKDNGKKMK